MKYANGGIQTASGNGVSTGMGRASSEGTGEVSTLDAGDATGLDEPGASGDEALRFAEEPLDEDENSESLEILRRRKVDMDLRRISFKNFMIVGCKDGFAERERVILVMGYRRQGPNRIACALGRMWRGERCQTVKIEDLGRYRDVRQVQLDLRRSFQVSWMQACLANEL
jgi:hypothetical protein